MAAERSIIIRISRLNYYWAYLLAGLIAAYAAWLLYNRFTGFALPVGLLAISAAIVVVVELFIITTELHLSHSNVVYRVGILSKDVRTIHYAKITDVRLTQSIVQRIFSIGDLYINTAGTYENEIDFKNISKARQVHEFLASRIRAHQTRR